MRGNVGLLAPCAPCCCHLQSSDTATAVFPTSGSQVYGVKGFYSLTPSQSLPSFGHFGPKPVFFKRSSSFLLRGRNDMLDDSQFTGDQWETCPRLHLIWWSGQDRQMDRGICVSHTVSQFIPLTLQVQLISVLAAAGRDLAKGLDRWKNE